ncbi:MAG: DNA recombination protein RmuC [bacterium]|nr:DNA recombination protein RmuC [bacterium]
MNWIFLIAGLIVGGTLGLIIAGLRSRAKSAEQQAEVVRLDTLLEQERSAAGEKIVLLEQAAKEMKDSFKALSLEALQRNNKFFLELAGEALAKQQTEARGLLEKQQTEAKGELEKREQAVANLVKPISESLEKVNKQVETMEKLRGEAFAGLGVQLKGLGDAQNRLAGETANLVQALRKPSVRGQWGEMQLRRVVEMAGMLEHCDFEEQVSVSAEEGRLRPDMIINLPGGKRVIVDAKTPLDGYLDALDAEDADIRQAHLQRHAKHVRTHIAQLSQKAYWSQFESTPDFVVMFLPSESIFYAALEQDSSLIEQGVDKKVILATPTTLIALLRTVSFGWQQEALADNARKISDLGRDLYERLSILGGHFGDLGKSLGRSVDIYNKAVGSLETRVLSAARKFPELGVPSKREIPEVQPVDRTARSLESPELLQNGDDTESD